MAPATATLKNRSRDGFRNKYIIPNIKKKGAPAHFTLRK